MKTVSELVKEVEAEPNAVRAADMGLEAVEAFALEAAHSIRAGGKEAAQDAIDNLAQLVASLRKAIPANVIPATAGPVGKSPKEQYLDQAHEVATEVLAKLQGSLADVHKVLAGISEVVQHASTLTTIEKVKP